MVRLGSCWSVVALGALGALAGCRQLLGLDDLPARHADARVDSPAGKIDAPRDAKIPRDAPPDAPLTVMGLLNVTPNVLSGTVSVNLTSAGTSDWAHWGYNGATGFDHKALGNSQIGNITIVGGTGQLIQVNSSLLTATWSDGTPDLSVTNNSTGVLVTHPNGMRITVPADQSAHTLSLYVGCVNSAERLDASLSDGSAPAYSNTQNTLAANPVHVRYDIAYRSAAAGQTLTVTWTDTGDTGGGGGATWWFATLQ